MREPRPFLGYRLSREDMKILDGLIGMTTMPCGLGKRQIKYESQIWEVTDKAFGLAPHPGESFLSAVRRIKPEIGKIPSSKRTERRNRAFPECYQLSMKRARADPNRSAHAIKSKKATTNHTYVAPTAKQREEFYLTWEWRKLRLEVLKQFGRRCQCCGARPGQLDVSGRPVRIVVDHIKSVYKHWHLRLDRSNCQVLCDECNQGKGAWDETDFRPDAA